MLSIFSFERFQKGESWEEYIGRFSRRGSGEYAYHLGVAKEFSPNRILQNRNIIL
jgi:hypothetical protein